MEELIINIKKCELWTDQLEDYLNKIGGNQNLLQKIMAMIRTMLMINIIKIVMESLRLI